jgi:hypothetical protein
MKLKTTKLINNFFALLVLIGCQQSASAQFSWDLGASVVIGLPKTLKFDETVSSGGFTTHNYFAYKVNSGGIGAFVFPKYHFKTIGKNSLSIGSPSSIAFSGSTNSQTGGSSSYLTDFNLSLDWNGGKYNKREDDSRSRNKSKSKSKSSKSKSSKRKVSSEDAPFGYYVGVGIGRSSTNSVGYASINDVVTASSSNLIAFDRTTNSAYDYMTGTSSGVFLQAGVGSFSFLENLYEPLGNIGLRVAFKPGLSAKALSYTTVSIFYSL